MRVVHSQPGAGAMAALAAVALVSAALAAATAGAAPAAGSGGFCGAAKGVGKQLVDSARSVSNTSSLAAQQAELKRNFGLIVAAEPALKGSVPKSLKAPLGVALRFVNLVNSTMTRLNWQFARIAAEPKTAAAILAAANRADPAMARIKVYLHNTCKLPV
jgi:hypothetical protein